MRPLDFTRLGLRLGDADESSVHRLLDGLLMGVRQRSRVLSTILYDAGGRLLVLSPLSRRLPPGLPADRLDAMLAVASDVEDGLIALAQPSAALLPDSTSPSMELCASLWSLLLRRGCPAHLVAEGYYLTSQLCYESKRDMASGEILYLLAHPAVCCRAEELRAVSELFRTICGGGRGAGAVAGVATLA